MEKTLTDGEREILSELEADAREGYETEGESCDWCNGSGMDGLDARTHDPILCPRCGGSGKEA